MFKSAQDYHAPKPNHIPASAQPKPQMRLPHQAMQESRTTSISHKNWVSELLERVKSTLNP
jgi:hypothetical protein